MWKSVGNFLARWYFLLQHHYLTTIFPVSIIFFVRIYISVILATWNDVWIFFFQIFHNLCFLFFVDIYAMQGRSHNISHLQWENPLHRAIWLKFRPSFTKFLRNLIMISIWEKVRIQQFRKAKYSLLASVLHIVQRFFLTEPHTYLCTM